MSHALPVAGLVLVLQNVDLRALGLPDDAGGDLPEPEEAREHRDAEQSLQLDLARALARLTPRQRELCQLLLEQDLSMVETSQRLGVPRSTLYEELKHIRTIFKALGLDAYLR